MPDNMLMQAGMDLFYHAFSHQLPGLKLARNIGLLAAQHAGKAKEAALRYALGINDEQCDDLNCLHRSSH